MIVDRPPMCHVCRIMPSKQAARRRAEDRRLLSLKRRVTAPRRQSFARNHWEITIGVCLENSNNHGLFFLGSEDEENKDRSIHCSRRGEQSRREPSVESQAPSRRETCFLATSLLVYQLVTEHRSRNINFSADISSSKGARETNTAAHIDDVI